MNLNKYIIRLLARDGYANVPGLGSFRLEHRTAVMLNNSILPPGDVVVFSENKECRDNALAELIMRDLKIKYPDAVSMVNDSVGDIDIHSLCGWQGSLPRNFGMSVIRVSEIHHDNTILNIGRYAAAVAVALLLNLTIPVNQVPDSPTAEARLIPDFFANTVKPEEQTAVTDIVVEEEPKNYCVIVSSLNSRQDAVDWIIAKSGCDSMEIIEGDGHYRVAAARFASYSEAASFIKNNNLSAWVLHTK